MAESSCRIVAEDNDKGVAEINVENASTSLTKRERKLLRRAQWKEERRTQLKKRKETPSTLKWSGSESATVLELYGVSRIAPYPSQLTANCKQRWIGRRVVDVLADEFNAYSLQYFEQAVRNGQLLINGERFAADYCFQARDCLVHHAHRHEAPARVLNPDHIIYRCIDRLVLNKPSSIPVHPCGRYQYNSIVHMLARKYGIDNAHPVHRLDRLTSGVLVLALNPESARTITNTIESKEMAKFYLARVVGEFPLSNNASNVSLAIDIPPSIEEISDCFQSSQWIISNDPIACISKKFSMFGVSSQNGKPCTTAFRRVNYNGRTSVVLCYPITGRTHQIRVHLQHLGFPIANDPCYGGKLCHGNTTLESGIGDDVEQSRLLDEFTNHVNTSTMPMCPECNQSNQHYVPADPVTQGGLFCSEIWLHALSYSCDEWSFTVPVPSWAYNSFDDHSYLQDVSYSGLNAL